MHYSKHAFCTYCYWYGPRPKGTTPGFFAFELVFWGLFFVLAYIINPLDGFYIWEMIVLVGFILPPLFYSGWRLSARRFECPICLHESLIPGDSPRAQVMIDQCNRDMARLVKEATEDAVGDDLR